jgi:hypothetical protein
MKVLATLTALLAVGCQSTSPRKPDPVLFPNQEGREKAQAEYDEALLAAYLLTLHP